MHDARGAWPVLYHHNIASCGWVMIQVFGPSVMWMSPNVPTSTLFQCTCSPCQRCMTHPDARRALGTNLSLLQELGSARLSRSSISCVAISWSPSQKVSFAWWYRTIYRSDARTLRNTDLHLFSQPSPTEWADTKVGIHLRYRFQKHIQCRNTVSNYVGNVWFAPREVVFITNYGNSQTQWHRF